MFRKLPKTTYLRGVYNGVVRYMRIYRPRSKDGHIEVFTPGLGKIYHHGNSVVCPQEGKTMGVHFLQLYQHISADEYYRVLNRHIQERCGVGRSCHRRRLGG